MIKDIPQVGNESIPDEAYECPECAAKRKQRCTGTATGKGMHTSRMVKILAYKFPENDPVELMESFLRGEN